MTAGAILAGILALLGPGAQAGERGHTDPRSQELLAYECSTEIGRRDLTLFANGTLRHRRRSDAGRRMHLAELERDELDAFIRRLEAEDLSEAESIRYGASGDWIEQCTVRLGLPGREPVEFRFGSFDSLELHLNRVVQIAEELTLLAILEDTESGLPYRYKPRRGDVLVRADGALFEVVGHTSDGNGVELRGMDEPLTVYLPASELSAEFVALERRANSPWPE